ncbi:hypothetical protein AIZ10_23450, partial [Salmonella enterica subsp. enterica serovar Typhimurium]
EYFPTPPPGKLYRLQGNDLVYDDALFVSALDSVNAQVIQAIKAHRDDVTAFYIVIDVNHFLSDANSRIQQMSLTR